jgi:hypothetical protein
MVSGRFSNDDDDIDGDLVVTFGMLRSDLVDMLSEIELAARGLESIVTGNDRFTSSELAAITAAIANYDSLSSVFSLSGEISQGEINNGAKKIVARMSILTQLKSSRESLRKSIMEDQNMTIPEKKKVMCIEDPDPYIKEVYGDEYS